MVVVGWWSCRRLGCLGMRIHMCGSMGRYVGMGGDAASCSRSWELDHTGCAGVVGWLAGWLDGWMDVLTARLSCTMYRVHEIPLYRTVHYVQREMQDRLAD